jgi:FlaA1/EpsC-like NDP-sugar epimerase
MISSIHKHAKSVLSLPRFAKRTIVIITDVSLCIVALWIALLLRLDNYQFSILEDNLKHTSLISIIIAIPVFWLMGLYRTMFRYSSLSVLVSVSFAILVYGLLFFSIVSIYGIKGIPRSIGVLQPILLLFIIIISRIFAEYILGGVYLSKKHKDALPKALIYGSGKAGRQLLSALDNSSEMKVVGFIDDDKLLHGQIMEGQSIFSPEDIGNLIEFKEITYILLALPSVSRSARSRILKKLNYHKVTVKTLPSVSDIIQDRVKTSDIRDLDVDDILDREQVVPNLGLLNKNTNSKTVLITGAGGSIGSELCKQIIKLNPHKLILIDINEYSLYKIISDLEDLKKVIHQINHVEIVALLASVQDKVKMTEIVKTWKPDIFYHAAAYKHVPLVEENICEGIKNNVFGTLISAQVAIENDISNMVLVSTDKAVRPTNIMGATKRLAELCLQALYQKTNTKKTKLSMVRFGNVLDSSGSVIPKFRKQIRNGGPITLTHPEVTRYFMTIPEASQLVIQAGAMAEGCDVFVLDMGKPVKIRDLIQKIVVLSGLTIQDKKNPEGDIKIDTIGLRPGEKLFEELLLGENPQSTQHDRIKKAQDPFIPWSELNIYLERLEMLVKKNDINEILNIFETLISGYKKNLKIEDQIFKEQKNVNQSILNSKIQKIQLDKKIVSIKK